MGYDDYLEWLQAVLPESMRPPSKGTAASPHSGFRRVPALTAEERALAEASLGGGSPDEVLASRFSVNLTRQQVECLLPGVWLNDEVINFYYKLLQDRCHSAKGRRKCWFPNSFFWPKLSSNTNAYSYKEVRRWTVKAKINIFELDYVIFPMNIGDMHWAMGAIDLRAKGFRYFDSMSATPHPNFVPFLRCYLQDEHKARKSAPLPGNIEDWDLIPNVQAVPQQRNCYDCGVFTCFFGDYFAAGKDLVFDQADMPDLRLRLAARITKADEGWEE